jgi:hypothetical protein
MRERKFHSPYTEHPCRRKCNGEGGDAQHGPHLCGPLYTGVNKCFSRDKQRHGKADPGDDPGHQQMFSSHPPRKRKAEPFPEQPQGKNTCRLAEQKRTEHKPGCGTDSGER